MTRLWRWGAEDPELRTALEQRQAADEALAEHNRLMKKTYGRRGIPPDAYDRWLNDHLQDKAAWKLEDVLNVQAELKAKRRAEKDERSWERFNRWTTAIDSTVDKYKLTRWSRMTAQERWDDQNDMNRAYADSQDRIARVAERFGLKRVAAKARNEIRVREFMTERQERSPNNPRNGGDGFNRGDGKWTDRRGDDWRYVEEYQDSGGFLDEFERGGQVGDDEDPDHLAAEPRNQPPAEYGLARIGVGEPTARSWGWTGSTNAGAVPHATDVDPRLLQEARDWVSDCQWKEDPEDLDEYSDDDIIRGVNRHYDGGWATFVRATGLAEHDNNGGSAMTAPTHGGDVMTIQQLRDLYEHTIQQWASITDQHTAVATDMESQAAEFEAVAGGIASEHDPQTRGEASAVLEALATAVEAHKQAVASADEVHATVSAAHAGLERHRPMEEAVASHPGPAERTAAYAPQ